MWQQYQASMCAVERRRLQVMALLAEGRSRAEVLTITRYSVPRLVDLIHRYHAQGLEGLRDRRHRNSGAPTLLTDAELLLLAQTIRADYTEGLVWNGPKVQQWIKTTLGKELYVSRAYEFLDAIGFSQQTARPRHVEADDAAQDKFKKHARYAAPCS
nr:winged helix-turn-helix domain-containing protein [Deinococcus betulae]